MNGNTALLRRPSLQSAGVSRSNGRWFRNGHNVVLLLESTPSFDSEFDELMPPILDTAGQQEGLLGELGLDEVTGESTHQPTLRRGQKGSAVRELQHRLNTWIGSGSSGLRPLIVDGDFGPLTQAAVLAFQRANGLGPDGIVGPLTWGRLLGATVPPPRTDGLPSLTAFGTFSRNYIDQIRSAGRRLDCADLAIEVWIAFGEQFGVPVRFQMWDSATSKYRVVSRTGFRTVAAYIRYVQSNLGAVHLTRNTYLVPGGHRAASPGDVFLWEYRHQTTNKRHRWGHTQLLYSVARGTGGPNTDRITIAQGSLPPIVPKIVEKPPSYFSNRRSTPIEGQPHWGIPIGPGPRRFNGFRGLI